MTTFFVCRYLSECYLSCYPPMFEAAEEAATEYYDCVKDTDDYTEIQRYEEFEWNHTAEAFLKSKK